MAKKQSKLDSLKSAINANKEKVYKENRGGFLKPQTKDIEKKVDSALKARDKKVDALTMTKSTPSAKQPKVVIAKKVKKY